MASLFEIVIYTASLSLYADPLLDELDPCHIASYRLFREHCTFYNNAFVKDLSILGRDLKDVIIVDNSPISYAFQPENAIPILTWIDDTTDNKLEQLASYLELLVNVEDVRESIKKIIPDNILVEQNSQQIEIEEVPEENNNKPLINTWVSCNTNKGKTNSLQKKYPERKDMELLKSQPIKRK